MVQGVVEGQIRVQNGIERGLADAAFSIEVSKHVLQDHAVEFRVPLWLPSPAADVTFTASCSPSTPHDAGKAKAAGRAFTIMVSP